MRFTSSVLTSLVYSASAAAVMMMSSRQIATPSYQLFDYSVPETDDKQADHHPTPMAVRLRHFYCGLFLDGSPSLF